MRMDDSLQHIQMRWGMLGRRGMLGMEGRMGACRDSSMSYGLIPAGFQPRLASNLTNSARYTQRSTAQTKLHFVATDPGETSLQKGPWVKGARVALPEALLTTAPRLAPVDFHKETLGSRESRSM